MATTCNICVENINKVNYKINCIACDFECCKTCFKRYITDSDHYFQCMSCNIEFDRSSLYKRLGATFMKNEYKYIREIMLFEIERGLLPATQLLLEKEIEIEKLRTELINISDKYDIIRTQKVQELNEFIKSTDVTTVCDAIHKYITLSESANMDEKIQDESLDIEHRIANMQDSKETVKKTFIRQCPQNACNGMLSYENRSNRNNYLCVLCTSISCAECREIVEDESAHTCNQEIIDTVKFIEESSKPCPSCASPIHKLEGCFGKNTIIPLINGLNKYAKEIEIGDQLVGDDFQPRTVLQTFNGTDLLYQVTQEHGDTYIVNSRHNLVLTKRSGVQYTIDLTTYLQLTQSQKDDLYGYKIIAATGKKVLSKLTIIPCKVDSYYGFVVDGNNKFLYTDGTVLANCDQMFCVNCHTAFSWKTLKIATGTIHNPHYFEWYRQQGIVPRNPLDIQCGQEVDHIIIRYCQTDINNILYKVTDPDTLKMGRVMNRFIEKIAHLHSITIPRYQGNNIYARNQTLRLQLLRKNINETNFKIRIQRSDKAESKKQDIMNILITYRDAATDITFRMVDIIKSRQLSIARFKRFYAEAYGLYNYVNTCLENVAATYGSNMSTNIFDY